MVSDMTITDRSGWLRFLLGFAILYGTLAGLAEIDATGRYGLLIMVAVLTAAVIVDRVFFGGRPRAALRRTGLGRPTARALLAAIAISVVVLAVYPLTAALTGTAPALRQDWPWLLVGILAFHGVAEELVWRGYVFRRLRAGRSFGLAVAWTMPLLAATHVPIFATSGPAVGAAAVLVAAVTTLPLAHLYETGGNTIWAPALVHAAIDSFKLVTIPAATTMTFSLLLAAISIVIPLLALGIRPVYSNPAI